MLKILILIFLFYHFQTHADERRCFDYILLDGGETLITYGMDTTSHWWAITQPFSEDYRLIVDGTKSDIFKEIRNLTFAPDGIKWACFVRNNVEWQLLTNDTLISIRGSDVGDIEYCPSSNYYIYSYFESNDEIVVYKDKKILTYQRDGKFYLSNNAEKYAWRARRGNGYVLIVNGNESSVYDDIKPIGFWYDSEFLYSIKNGNNWEIYKGNNCISEIYKYITEMSINLQGNVAAVLATEPSGLQTGILISDDYYEPLIGNRYDQVFNLVLHPSLPMLAYNAKFQGQDMVILNSAEYYGGNELTGSPQFTFDGEDLYYLGCDLHCFVNINGRKYPLNGEIDINRHFAKKTGSNTIAYSSSSSLMIRDIESNELHSGIMADQIISPRYNWRSGAYETLGSINNRLYLMTCRY